MCVLRFEEKPKKFNDGSAVRLIDILRKYDTDRHPAEKLEKQDKGFERAS